MIRTFMTNLFIKHKTSIIPSFISLIFGYQFWNPKFCCASLIIYQKLPHSIFYSLALEFDVFRFNRYNSRSMGQRSIFFFPPREFVGAYLHWKFEVCFFKCRCCRGIAGERHGQTDRQTDRLWHVTLTRFPFQYISNF